MSTRRKRPVLFEMGRRSSAPAWKPRNSLALKQIMEAQHSEVDSAEPSTPDSAPSPLFLDSGRGGIEITLRWPALAILGGAAVVLMIIAFYAGQQVGRGRAPKQDLPLSAGDTRLQPGRANELSITPAPRNDTARRDTDVPLVPRGSDDRGKTAEPPKAKDDSAKIEPPTAAENQPNAPESDSSTFVAQRDQYYLVIQHFRKSEREAAERAGRFLEASGIRCALLIGADVRLIATEPFDKGSRSADTRKREEQRSEGLKRQIRELGKQYNREGGGYVFDQPTLQKLSD